MKKRLMEQKNFDGTKSFCWNKKLFRIKQKTFTMEQKNVQELKFFKINRKGSNPPKNTTEYKLTKSLC